MRSIAEYTIFELHGMSHGFCVFFQNSRHCRVRRANHNMQAYTKQGDIE